jgi:hypothetical protein
MAHDHHHHHDGESVSNYFTEQLLTILVCGFIGFAAIQMYRTDRLGFLAEQFRGPVLYGGIGVLALVGLRSVAVWKEAGAVKARMQACAQDHVHTEECNHDHAHAHGAQEHHHHDHSHIHDHSHDHSHDDHGHSHDMSWVFARMLILAFPVALYFIGLPATSFSMERQMLMMRGEKAMGAGNLEDLAKKAEVIDGPKEVGNSIVTVYQTDTKLKVRKTEPKDGGQAKYELITQAGRTMKFAELNDAALDSGKRGYMEGETAILEGRFKRLADKEFSLFRMKMTCCASDTVPLKVRIIVPQALAGFEDFDWVRVKGQIQFWEVPGQNRFIPVLMVADISDLSKPPPQNEYEQ